MKTVFRSVFALAVAAVAICSCNKDLNEGIAPNAIKVDFIAQSPDTKAVFGDLSGTQMPVLWQEGDKVKLSLGATEVKDPVTVVPSSDFKSATFSAELSTFPASVYALCPVGAWVSTSSNSTYGDYIQYMISSTQTPVAGSVDPGAMPVIAAANLDSAPTGAVPVTFSHLAAYGKLTLVNFPTGKTVKGITLDFSEANIGIAGRCIFKESDGSFQINPNSMAYTITLNTSSIENVFFSIVATDISNATFKVIVEVEGGNYVKTVTAPANRIFKAGTVSSFSINMSGADFEQAKVYKLVTDISSLAAGDQLIIASVKTYSTDNITGHSLLSTQVNTNNLQATCCEDKFVNGDIVNPPVNVEVLTLSESSISGTWMLKSASNGGYLARKNSGASKNYACYYSDTDFATEALLKSASWNISEEDATTHAVTMLSNCPLSYGKGYGGYFRTNIGSSYIFSCYGSGKQDPVCLYRLATSN
jgi:hypothetical protein